MIEKLALRIVNQMEMQKIINKSSCEYYQYALIFVVFPFSKETHRRISGG